MKGSGNIQFLETKFNMWKEGFKNVFLAIDSKHFLNLHLHVSFWQLLTKSTPSLSKEWDMHRNNLVLVIFKHALFPICANLNSIEGSNLWCNSGTDLCIILVFYSKNFENQLIVLKTNPYFIGFDYKEWITFDMYHIGLA